MPLSRTSASPDRPARALGLVRVSKEGGRGDALMSPTMQRDAIGSYCEARGYQLTTVLEAIDESGSQSRSAWWPRLDDAIRTLEHGEYDVIVVWKFSRTARNRLKWAIALDRVETAGGRIESATEQVDATTSTGRFTRGMLAELNAFEAERIGEVWREVQAARVGKGLTHNGRRRFGYVVVDKAHAVDDTTGPVLADLYRRFTAGETITALVRRLNAAGHPTTTGAVWSERTLRRVLDDGFAAGLIAYDGVLHEGAHPPLISRDEWAAYRAAKAARARVAPRSQRSPYLLSGMVRCAWCKGSMNAGTFGEGRVPKYRCETKRATGGAGCQRGGYVSAAHVHAELLRWLVAQASEKGDEVEEGRASPRPVEVASPADEAARAAAEVRRLDGLLLKLARQRLEDDLPDETFHALRDDYRDRLAKAKQWAAETEHLARSVMPLSPDVVLPLVESWHTLSVERRRTMLRRVIRHVEVEKRERGTAAVVRPVPLI